jgi:hypothetical protein
MKHRERAIDQDNNFIDKRYVDVRIVGDERIVDGHYYANSFKLFKRLMQHPERLETPPEHVVEDVI